MGPITKGELNRALSKMKIRKSVGEDDVSPELLKWMGGFGKAIVHDVLNCIFEIKEIARVVEIYKTGDVTDPENYKPISLLSTIYKLFTRIIQVKLAKAIDHRLFDIQYGFREDRYTSEFFIHHTEIEGTLQVQRRSYVYADAGLGESFRQDRS